MQEEVQDWRKANKAQLLAKLLPTLEENQRLRESVARLMKAQRQQPHHLHPGRPDDFVPAGWPERHNITIPRADGYFESGKAWLRIDRGVITIASLKNQSILSLMIAGKLLDEGAQKHANIYTDWRAAFFARHEAARYDDHGTGDPEAWSKEDRYSKLLKAVDRPHLRRVDIIVAGRPKEKEVTAFNSDAEVFKTSFLTTARAIKQINKDAEDYLEAINSARQPPPRACKSPPQPLHDMPADEPAC